MNVFSYLFACFVLLISLSLSSANAQSVSQELEQIEANMAFSDVLPIGQAIARLKELSQDSSVSKSDIENAHIFALLSEYSARLNQSLDQPYLQQAQQYFSNPTYGSIIKVNVGRIWANKGDYSKSIATLEQVIGSELLDHHNLLMAYNYLIISYAEHQQFYPIPKVIDLLSDILSLEDDLIARCYFDYARGYYYSSLNQEQKAIAYYQGALDQSKKLNRWALFSDLLYAIGISYRNSLDVARAIQYFNKVIEFDKHIDIQYAEFYALYGITTTQLRVKDYLSAIASSESVLKHAFARQDFNAEIFKGLALAYIYLKDVDKALVNVQQAELIYQNIPELKGTTWQIETLRIRASLAELKNDFEQAYVVSQQYYKKYIESLEHSDRSQLQKLNSTYEFRQEQAKNKRLVAENEAKAVLLEKTFAAQKEQEKYALWLKVIAVMGGFLASYLLFLNTRAKQINRIENEAKLKALRLSELKSNFVANVSHEIRTPLNAVLGFSQVLQRETKDESQRKLVNKIYYACDTLLQLINDILDFSKIEAHKLELNNKSLSLHQMLESVKSIFETQMRDKGLVFKINIATDVPEFLIADELRLKQILVNLLSNAMKFTHQGHVQLTVLCQSAIERHCCLEFKVKDDGIGLNDEQQEKVFQPFMQAESSTATHFGGTGLGLSISQALLKLMDSELKLESKQGEGSHFSFILNLKTGSNTQAKEDCLEVYDYDSFKGIKVLIVEDNFINVEVLKAMLSPYNFDLSVANNGQEALDTLSSACFGLIFMDVQMPVMDGYETTEVIRKKVSTQVPIVALTANAMQSDIDKCLACGMNAHVAKPIEKKELEGVIHQWLK